MSMFIAIPFIIVIFTQNHDCQPAGGTKKKVRDSLAFFICVYHEYLSKMSWQSIQLMLKYFRTKVLDRPTLSHIISVVKNKQELQFN